jgi:hypothetical protein
MALKVEKQETKVTKRPIENKDVKATDGMIRLDANHEVREDIYPNLRIIRNAR